MFAVALRWTRRRCRPTEAATTASAVAFMGHKLSVDYSEQRTDGTPIPVTSGGHGGTRRSTYDHNGRPCRFRGSTVE